MVKSPNHAKRADPGGSGQAAVALPLQKIRSQKATRDEAREHPDSRPIRFFNWSLVGWARTPVADPSDHGHALAPQIVEKTQRDHCG